MKDIAAFDASKVTSSLSKSLIVEDAGTPEQLASMLHQASRVSRSPSPEKINLNVAYGYPLHLAQVSHVNV